jgi:hypothetical protein
MTRQHEQKIRDDERKRIGRLLIGVADAGNFDPATADALRDIGKIFATKTTKQLQHEGLMVILEELIDEAVAAGRGERITIRGKPGYRAYPNAAALA